MKTFLLTGTALLAIAAQGARIYRNMFGVVTVSDGDNFDHGHH